MLDTMTRYLAGVAANADRQSLRQVLAPVVDRYASLPLNSAGLVIKAGGGVLAKTGAADFYAVANGTLVKIAAGTDMPSLLGLVITANSFNVACFFIDSAAVVTVAFGTQATTIGGVVWPQFPAQKSLVGFLLITHSSTFTGNTTPLDTATTVFVNATSGFDPTVRL